MILFINLSVALLEEMELTKQLLQEKEREIDSMKSLLEENKGRK